MCSPSQPSVPDKTTQTVELPEWAKPYAKDTLAKGAALTDINQNPYKQYGGERIAGFQPLQEQAFKTVGGMDAGPAGFQAGIGQYMSPYMQNVVDIEKREAGRQSGIMGTQQQAQATQAGAFGGGRDAIMRAERERNLSQQMGDIQSRGSQAAYEQAANQFRQGIQQQSGLAQMQGQMGAQQQQQAQRPLDMAYQDFINQQNYPYKQLGFMSDMVRGLPLGQQSTQSVYQAPPSTLQTVGALGMGAYGLNQMYGSPSPKAEGGLAGSYAGGGMVAFRDGGDTDIAHSPMDDPTEMARAVSKLSDEQLQQIIQQPSSAAELQAAKTELATRASESRGLASAYNMMPEQAPTIQATPQAPMVQAARGGIMGFAGNDQSLVTEDKMREVLAELNDDEEGGTGDADQRAVWNQRLGQSYENIMNYQPRTMTEDQRRANTKAYYQEVQDMAGPNPYKAQGDRIAEQEKQQAGELRQQKGLAAIAAIPAILQGSNAVRGLGAGAGKFGDMYGKALQADRAEKRALMSAKNNLEDAQYKMRVGLVGEARQLTEAGRRDQQAADAAHIAKNKALGEVAAKAVKLNAPAKAATRNFDIENKEDIAEDLKSTNPMKEGETPAQYKTRLNAMAARIILELKGTKDIKSTSTVSSNVTSDIGDTKKDVEESKVDVSKEELSSKEAEDANTKGKKAALRNEDWQNATSQDEKDKIEKRLIDREIEIKLENKRKLSGDKPTSKPPAAQPLPANATAADLKDGVVYSTSKGPGKWNAKTQKFTPVAAQ